jgi:inhibitor of KinA
MNTTTYKEFMMGIEIQPLGDTALRVSFGNSISKTIHKEIQQFVLQLQLATIKGIIEWVPAYTTVTIFYKPELISNADLDKKVQDLLSIKDTRQENVARVYEIPVYYGGDAGQDLPYLTEHLQMSAKKIIELHSSQEYLIYMIGFVPGFPYLGGLPEKLAVPRLEHPRPSVPAGSVGIGGQQTGIYPVQVPSGWRIIGRTPVKLFDLANDPPVLLSAGNYVKFFSITKHEFDRTQLDNNYKVSTYIKKD